MTMVADINTLRGGGYSWQFSVGSALRFSKSWPCFGAKMSFFHIRFQTWPLKSRPTWPETLCHHYLDWNGNILKFIFEFANYSFFHSFLFIWNWNGKCAHTLDPVVPSDHTRLQTKTDKIYSCFQTETAQKPSGQRWGTYMIYQYKAVNLQEMREFIAEKKWGSIMLAKSNLSLVWRYRR